MVVAEISKEYADMIFDEKDSETKTRPLNPRVATLVGTLLYVDNPRAITASKGRTTLKRLITPNKTAVFSVYGLTLDSGNVDIHFGGTYIDTSLGAPPAAAISKDDEERLGDGVFHFLSEYINIKNKQPRRALSKELTKTPLPADVSRYVGDMAYGKIPPPVIIKRKYAGKRRTRKGKKSRKMRKTRGRRRTQRGGNDEETLQKKAAETLQETAAEACKKIDAVNDIKDIKEATKIYWKAAKVVHPDKGGSKEAFQVLEACYGKKMESLLENKKSLEVPQPANNAAPSPARSDETGKADLYVYFYRNGEPVEFDTLTEDQKSSVRTAVVHKPFNIEGTFGIVKAPVDYATHVKGKGVVEFTVAGITPKLRGDPIGGRRKSRR